MKVSDVYKIYIDSYRQYSILAVVILAFAKELVPQHAIETARLLAETSTTKVLPCNPLSEGEKLKFPAS